MDRKERMLELLTYEPFGGFLRAEKTYISWILSEKKCQQPKSMLHDSFTGFCDYVQKGDFKDIDWLRCWKDTYFPKDDHAHYPLLFKKICFYIIVQCKIINDKFTDKKFVEMLNLRENLIRKWNLSAEFRKYAESDTYSVIKSYRSGAKKPYIVSIVKRLYYEAGLQVSRSKQLEKENLQADQFMLFKKAYRQVKQSMTLSKLPTFVDVFAGTASVAASMGAAKGFPPPVVNDFDPVMVSFAWAFTYCQRELRKRIAEFHNKLMKMDFESTDWSYDAGAYEETIDPRNLLTSPKIWDDPGVKSRLMEFFGYSEADIDAGRMLAQRHQELVMRIRSSYIDVKKDLDSCDRDAWRKTISFNESPKDMSKEQVKEILKYAFAMYYFFSFPPFGKNGNVYEETIVDACSYYSFLSRMQNGLDAVRRENKAVKAWTLSELQLKASLLTLESTGKFSKHLRRATFCCKDFKEILQDDPSNKVYYLDSPYFFTIGYDVGFSDDDHKNMLDILRDADFKWIFSMQYNPSKRNKCTSSSDEAERKKKHIIKDYGAYYRGFYAPFQKGADQKVYNIPKDAPMDDEKILYVILFDFDAVKEKWPEMKTETREMLVVNFNCLPAIPLHDTAVVLPFDLFLQCADKGKDEEGKKGKKGKKETMSYQEIVQVAKNWRKENIANNYTGKAPV